MIKLKDVAEKAGVSQTTASMALSGKGRISREVRQRVIKAADILGYSSNRPIKASRWILLHDTSPANDALAYFFNPVIRKLQDQSEKQGFILEILPVKSSRTDEELYDKVSKLNPACLLSLQFARVDLFRRLEEKEIPCVVINNSTYLEDFLTVCADDFNGAYEGTKRLLEQGHREIGFLDYARDLDSVVSDRYYGFLKAMEEKGQAMKPARRRRVDVSDYNSIEKAVEKLLADDPQISALFLHDDLLGAKVHHCLLKMGKKIPGDISLIAPGDTKDYSQEETLPLSTMKIDTALMGQYAVNMMTERLSGSSAPSHALKIKQIFADRGTVGKKR